MRRLLSIRSCTVLYYNVADGRDSVVGRYVIMYICNYYNIYTSHLIDIIKIIKASVPGVNTVHIIYNFIPYQSLKHGVCDEYV